MGQTRSTPVHAPGPVRIPPVLEYIEKIALIENQNIKLIDLKIQYETLLIPNNIYSSYAKFLPTDKNARFDMAFDCNDKEVMCVCEDSKKPVYIVLILYKNFSVKTIYTVPSAGKSAVGVLLQEMKTINHNVESVEHALGIIYSRSDDKPTSLPLERYSVRTGTKTKIFSPTTNDTKHVLNACYDKYEKNFMFVLEGSYDLQGVTHPRVIFEVWSHKDNGWIFEPEKSSRSLVRLVHNEPDATMNRRYEIDRIECSRNSILLTVCFYGSHIHIVRKGTYEHVGMMGGWGGYHIHPTFYDDYPEWIEKNIKIFKEVREMDKLVEGLLKLILSFVG